MFSRLKELLVGGKLSPFNPASRQHISLIALLAWVGLGADPLSSSCYGPEEAFLALGTHTHLALYIAAITVVTIFIISVGYNQVMELFPSGGGGYKVASKLLHPYAGLISGSALMVDYVLTIAVSIASGADAVFSFLPGTLSGYKLYIEAATILVLLFLNLRGMKEAITVLLPVFLGFVVSHFILIIYGIVAHSHGLTTMLPLTVAETKDIANHMGWLAVVGLTLHAYSLGSGTYTGLEAISNSVHRLAEPRVQTGKRAMLYMAVSLSFMAGGIILLYLLWGAQHVPGQTLNATVFHAILGESWLGRTTLIVVLLLEAGLLFVAANTGFASGPTVLANMAVDNWIPNRFRHLSNRLVIQNGCILYGIAAVAILLWTHGDVSTLVVLYSINVFITFSLSLLGITIYWLKHRASHAWLWHFIFSAFACLVTTSILGITLYYKFSAGGWLTLLVTSCIASICYLINRHYQGVSLKLAEMDKPLEQPITQKDIIPHALNPQLPTAIIFVNYLSVGMHALLSILRLFPNQFKNFVFVSVGVVDSESFSGQTELEQMESKVDKTLDYFVKYCHQYHLPAEGYAAFGTDPVEELERLADGIGAKYPHAIFFTSQLVFRHENMITRALHNQIPLILQRYLHFQGRELMILPMKI